MCVRISLTMERDAVEEALGTPLPEGFPSGFSHVCAYTRPTVGVLFHRRRSVLPGVARWGLVILQGAGRETVVPNARWETLSERPLFRRLLERGERCVLVVDGFYETIRRYGVVYPLYCRKRVGGLFFLAGLLDVGEGRGKESRCVVLTRSPRRGERGLFPWPRVPCILEQGELGSWIMEGRLTSEGPFLDEYEVYPVRDHILKDPSYRGADATTPFRYSGLESPDLFDEKRS